MWRVEVGFASVLWSEVGNYCSLFKCSDPTVEILSAIKNAVETGFNFLVTEEEKITTLLETMVIR